MDRHRYSISNTVVGGTSVVFSNILSISLYDSFAYTGLDRFAADQQQASQGTSTTTSAQAQPQQQQPQQQAQ